MKRDDMILIVLVTICLSSCFDSEPSPHSSNEEAANTSVEIDTSGMTDDQIYLVKAEQLEGVKKTASGLLYKIHDKGHGAQPTPASRVEVHYEGKLIDGTVFDSSYVRGKPASFGVGQVIAGWTEGLQLMREGAKFDFYIPSELGYGSQGTGGNIPPNATLIFRVELLRVH